MSLSITPITIPVRRPIALPAVALLLALLPGSLAAVVAA